VSKCKEKEKKLYKFEISDNRIRREHDLVRNILNWAQAWGEGIRFLD